MIEARLFSLDDIYGATSGRIFMTGIQALVRLPLMQRRFDRARGLSTAGLISGYRGSPLGAYDQQLWKAGKFLDAHDITFQPALNEDLGATALWGAQMHRAFGSTKVDGVFGIWYGKGNGVDRTGDVFRMANMYGTSPLGGVLAIAGDDHAAQSSIFPHQTDGILQSVMMPVLQPASVSDILVFGLAGIALSRFAGVWVGMKTIAEVVESAASFELPEACPEFHYPTDLVPHHGLNWDATIAWPAQRAEYERRMGGEGAQWIGAAPFSDTQHIFQNLGDGTYQHSGLLAIRAAVAAKANITYKILYNDAVAMTGGQPAEGAPTPQAIAAQLLAEGVGQVRLVSDDPDKRRDAQLLPAPVGITHRDTLDAVQRELRDVPGVTAILYEQTCAAEKRRRRKRGAFPDPNRRLFINPRVWEGCGDCSVQSNCIAIEPLPTAFGTKRKVNQSACNKDFSCVKGFCPSFVEVDAPKLRKPDGERLKAIEAERFPGLPLPALPVPATIFNIYVAGRMRR